MPLFDSVVYPVCSPQLLKEFKGKITPADLVNLPLLSVETEFDYWNKWFVSANVEAGIITPHMVVDTKAVALEMAINNEGIALVNGPFVDNDLESGQLVKPCQHETVFSGSWGIICRKENKDREDIQSLVNWLLTITADM